MFCLLSNIFSVLEFVILYANMLVYRRIFVEQACMLDFASTCICDKMKKQKIPRLEQFLNPIENP